jgi:hypothetical protein
MEVDGLTISFDYLFLFYPDLHLQQTEKTAFKFQTSKKSTRQSAFSFAQTEKIELPKRRRGKYPSMLKIGSQIC